MKSLFEQLGGTYTRQGDYCLPDVCLPPEEERPKKILLSDSNEALSMLLADSLRERGNFHVFHAKDEDETTKALHRHRPHVLLLDFLLPHKGGFHVMQHLREDGYKISTIFMTALPTHRVIEEAYRLGASFVLPKPFTARALVERIHDALHSDRP